MPHAEAILYSKIVQDCPSDLEMRIVGLVAWKITLTVRVDSFDGSLKGDEGKFLLNEIERRIENLQEPSAVKAIKPLQAPIDPGKNKRDGRRHRKMKERLGMTQLRGQANQMKFGKIEEDAYQEDFGFFEQE